MYCNGIQVANVRDEKCDQSLNFDYDVKLQLFDHGGYYYGEFCQNDSMNNKLIDFQQVLIRELLQEPIDKCSIMNRSIQ